MLWSSENGIINRNHEYERIFAYLAALCRLGLLLQGRVDESELRVIREEHMQTSGIGAEISVILLDEKGGYGLGGGDNIPVFRRHAWVYWEGNVALGSAALGVWKGLGEATRA